MAERKFKFVSPGVFINEIDNSEIPREPGAPPLGPSMRGASRVERISSRAVLH